MPTTPPRPNSPRPAPTARPARTVRLVRGVGRRLPAPAQRGLIRLAGVVGAGLTSDAGPLEPPPRAGGPRRLVSEVRAARLLPGGQVEVTGWSFVRPGDTPASSSTPASSPTPASIELVAVGPVGVEPVRVPADLTGDDEVNRADVDRTRDRSGTSFRAVLSLPELAARAERSAGVGPGADHRWRIEVRVRDDATDVTEPFGTVAGFGSAAVLPPFWFARSGRDTRPDRMAVVRPEAGEGLLVRIRRPGLFSGRVRVDGETVRIRLRTGGRVARLLLLAGTRARLVQQRESRHGAGAGTVPAPARDAGSAGRSIPLSVRGGDLVVPTARLAALGAQADGRWTVQVRFLVGRAHTLRWGPHPAAESQPGRPPFAVLGSPTGLLRLDWGAEAARVVAAELQPGDPARLLLTVAGLAVTGPAGLTAERCRLVGERSELSAEAIEAAAGRTMLTFALAGPGRWDRTERPAASGRYRLLLPGVPQGAGVFGEALAGTDDGPSTPQVEEGTAGGDLSVGVDPVLAERMGERTDLDRFGVRIERTGRGEFAIRISPPRAPGEAGRFRASELATEYRPVPAAVPNPAVPNPAVPNPAVQNPPVPNPPVPNPPAPASAGLLGGTRVLTEPLQPAVFLDTFDGRSTGDNPAPIRAELLRRRPDLVTYCVVSDHAVAVPEGTVGVVWYSREYFEARARSQFVVTNCWLTADFVARPGQRVLQTWHGTPLKRMGLDRIGVDTSDRYRRDLTFQTSQWTWLLSQNAYSSEIFTRAYRLADAGVEVAETGYPRNDVLARGLSDQGYRQVRDRLGLRPGERVVLFAPTWRENGRSAVDGLDLDRLTAGLGPEWRVLVRGHVNTVRGGSDRQGDRVLDVTTYPELTDLFAVADVMVTDYSSAMFDFAVTGKPMVFFVPDLSEYVGALRGTYFDLGEAAPGPLVTSTEAVVDEVGRAAAGVPAELTERYRRWRERFTPFDDGHATERAVDLLLGEA